jgi:phage terminase large subunit
MAIAEVDAPETFAYLYDPPLGEVRYRVGHSGRDAGKSWQFARALIIHGYQRPLRVGCFREYQTTIRESVHHLLVDQIKQLGLAGAFKIGQREILGPRGTEFVFRGLRRDPHGSKSMEALDIAWVEEAQVVSRESWDILIPTVRKEGSEIWVTFNPGEADDPTSQMFLVNPDPNIRSIIRKHSYLENPWLSRVMLEEANALKRRDPEAYAHTWGGELWGRSDLQVFAGKYRVADFTPEPHWGDPLFGADWGFSQDPSVLVKLFVVDSRLYIAAEAGGIQLDMDDLARAFDRIPGARDHTIRADAARPETINEMKRRGFRVQAAPKWEGSVLDGIEYLRGNFEEIVIHPSCTRAIEEARLYRYKADKRTGDPLPKLAEGNDHVWDAVRYALAPLIRRTPAPRVWFPGMATEPKT